MQQDEMHFLIINGFHAIFNWFNQHKRNLPWRGGDSPYLVWVSEMMLQQTQVDVVIPYFLKWKARFPTLRDLALAPLDDVLKLFAGLGYYSRARHLHRAAQICLEQYAGKLPDNKEALLTLPGIGSYSAGAILSFGFKKKAAAVDGNVLRVLLRYTGSQDPIDLPKTKKKIETLIEEALPDENPYVVMEGLIELGALICKKQPKCLKCPLKLNCQAYLNSQEHQIPVKKGKLERIRLNLVVFIYRDQDRFFVIKKQPGEWNAGLYEFFSKPIDGLEVEMENEQSLPVVRSSITKHHLTLIPKILEKKPDELIERQGEWVSISQLEQLPFSSAHQKICQQLVEIELFNFARIRG